MTGKFFDIQEMTIHDGPGVRVTFFMKGCPLRCQWCHNPEGQKMERQLMYKKNRCQYCQSCESFTNPQACPTGALSWCGFELSVDEVVKKAVSLKETLELMEGGVTFSGGEPLMQSEFLIQCLHALKKEGIHTCIETSGYCDESVFEQILSLCDYVYMDLKLMDDEEHLKWTGVSNQKILRNAQRLMNSSVQHCFRTPVIEGKTDHLENLNKIQQFVGSSLWEKIPSNPLAYVKYEQLIKEKASQ